MPPRHPNGNHSVRAYRHRVGPHLPWTTASELLLRLRERGKRGAWIDRRIYTLAAVALYCGLRRNELLCLRRDQIDLQLGIIWIEPHPEIAEELKTEDSEQPVPIPPELIPELAAWLAETPGRYVFPGVRGDRPWRGGTNGRRPVDRLRQAAKECGIDVRDWKTLRRTWATAAEGQWGRSDAEIQRVLRHTTKHTSNAPLP